VATATGPSPQGIELRAHVPTLDRDLIFFLVFFGSRSRWLRRPRGSGWSPGSSSSPYPIYVWRTLVRGGETQPEETLNP
jgi:hypothetical protein